MTENNLPKKLLKIELYRENLPKIIVSPIQENFELNYFEEKFPNYSHKIHLFLLKCNKIKFEDFRQMTKIYGKFKI